MQTVVLQQPSMLTPHSGLYFLHLFARLSAGATAHKAEFAQSQNWLNQQVRNGIREREGAAIFRPIANRRSVASRFPLFAQRMASRLIRSQYGESLQILMIVVALVLLIACANLANFLLSRATTRRHEILTRLALGSNRMRIVRQGLVETFLLSIVGGLMGLGIAFAATRALIAFVSRGNAYIDLSPSPKSGRAAFHARRFSLDRDSVRTRAVNSCSAHRNPWNLQCQVPHRCRAPAARWRDSGPKRW